VTLAAESALSVSQSRQDTAGQVGSLCAISCAVCGGIESRERRRPVKQQSKPLPQKGDLAPDFTAITDTGDPFRLSGQRGSWVCLFFYPKDDTPG